MGQQYFIRRKSKVAGPFSGKQIEAALHAGKVGTDDCVSVDRRGGFVPLLEHRDEVVNGRWEGAVTDDVDGDFSVIFASRIERLGPSDQADFTSICLDAARTHEALRAELSLSEEAFRVAAKEFQEASDPTESRRLIAAGLDKPIFVASTLFCLSLCVAVGVWSMKYA